MARRSPGEGSVTRRSNGLWQASIQLDSKRRTVYGRTRAEAGRKLAELKAQATNGGLPMPGKATVNDLLDAWLDNAPDLKDTTRAHYRVVLDTYAREAIGHVKLSRLTPDKVQRLYTGLTPSVADRLHRTLHRAFAVGVLWRWLGDNPCDRVLRPKYTAERRDVWTPAELAAFLAGAREHWLYSLWVVAIGTGLRSGELRALTWADFDADAGTLTVGATMHRLAGEYVRSEPKTRDSSRVVGLPAEAIAALRRQKAQQAERRLQAGGAWDNPELVFTGEAGQPLHKSTVKNALQRECRRLGLPVVNMHGLRHLHASLLLEAGVSIPQVSKRLGHATPAITLGIYAHVVRRDDAAATEAIARAMQG